MSKKKSASSLAQHRNRPGKRLGMKVYASQKVKAGQILVRQRGSKFQPGEKVGIGRDHTLYALQAGEVVFKKKLGKRIIDIR